MYGGLSNFKYKNLILSGAVEYSADGKMRMPVSRRIYASDNWELVHELLMNPYRVLPVQTTINNPSVVRVSPIIRLVGGGYLTYVGRIINETNGSSLYISGTLRPGEELAFNPMDPFLPKDFTLGENKGPNGVFSLEPGNNSILCQVQTLWGPYASGGTISWLNAVRHLELRNILSYRYTGRLRFSQGGGTLTIQSYHSGSSGSYGITLATASMTASFTPWAQVRVLTTTPSGGSTVGGHVVLYEGTYSGSDTNPLFVPLVEMIVPTTALTIEEGTN